MLTNISNIKDESLILELSAGEDIGTIGGYCEEGFPIYYANNKMAHMLGYEDVDELIAGIDGKVANTIHPDDMERVVKELNNGNFYEGMTYKITYRMPKKDGTSLWTVDKGKVIRAEDGRLAIISICSDMTSFIDRHAELERLNREQLSVFDSLARGFQNVFWINLTDGTAKILKLEGYITSGLDKEDHKFFDYPTTLNAFIRRINSISMISSVLNICEKYLKTGANTQAIIASLLMEKFTITNIISSGQKVMVLLPVDSRILMQS